jgi:tetratricopeptide (TPR) repeat protein
LEQPLPLAKELDDAVLYLEDADSGFVIIEVNEPRLQDTAIEHIASGIAPKKCLVIDLKNIPSDTTHLNAVKQKAAENTDVAVFLILNLHTCKPPTQHISSKHSPDKRDDIALVRDLNSCRDAYNALGKILVFFLPVFFVDLMFRHARDFLDYVPVKFKALSEPVHELDNIRELADEKFLRNRIAFLKSVLESEDLSESEKADKLYKIAECYLKLYEYETALNHFQEALAVCRNLEDWKNEALLLNQIGYVYDMHGKYEEGLRYYEQSLGIRREIGDKSGEGKTLNNISQIFKARGDYDTALKYLEQSLGIIREIGDKSGEGTTLNNISQIFKARRDYDTALKYLEQSLAIFKEIGDKSGEGTTLNNISQIYNACGDYDTVLKYLEQSLAIFKEIGDKKSEGTTINNIAAISYARGDYDTALKYLEQSLGIRREIGDKSGMAQTLYNMGHIAKQSNDMEKAVSLWKEAHTLAMETGDARELFYVAWSLGSFYADTNEKETARKLLTQASEIGKKAGFPDVQEVEALLQQLDASPAPETALAC